MIKYLKPLQLFGETMERTHHMPSAVFLGLNFSDEYTSVAISDDCYLTAIFCGHTELTFVDLVSSEANDYIVDCI
ncbi:hypothetical protein Ddye_002600 [Dipteronia dyeriana]|uniref:Uncharacterized protein n=1 Tax=Dipteronia dyeriana TaxID=168575 RepID=A0AAD9XRB0_9ROSI|nr:hypothetical protein Ddye_002600 [Dipteronia dyeriana]